MPTVGLMVAAAGAVLLLASLFALDFVTFEGTDLAGAEWSESLSLGDVGGSDQIDTSGGGRSGLYLDTAIVVGLGVVAAGAGWSVIRHRFPDPEHPAPRAITAVTLLILGWHLLAMFQWETMPGVSATPTLGAWVGALGYVALAASPWLSQPLTGRR